MIRPFVALLTLLLALPASAQTPSQLLDQIDAASKALRAQLTPPPPPQIVPIATNAELTAALLKGGTITLAPGAQFTGAFTIAVSGTTLVGNSASIAGPKGAAAIYVPPDVDDVAMSDLTVTSADDQRVILLGRNDSAQTTLEHVPQHITLTRITIPTFRGKRGIEVNAANVTLVDCTVLDVYDPAGRDSQAVAVANTPGPVTIRGGSFNSGSEPFLAGGSVAPIAGVVPSDILIEDATFFRPLSWQTDGVRRQVKNLIEFKTGHRVIVRRVTLDGAWRDAQDGFAIVITPHSGGDIHDVLLDHLTIRNVSACLQVLGQEYATTELRTPSPTSGIQLTNSTCTASKQFGLLGIGASLSGAPADVSLVGNTFILDGTRIAVYDAGTVLAPSGTTTQPAGPMASLTFTNNRVSGGMLYDFILQGQPHLSPLQTGVTSLSVTGNTFADASSTLKKNAPQNTYVTGADFAALVKQLSAPQG